MLEADLYPLIQLAASKRGDRLWRNNVGAAVDSRGIPIRYGLANSSAQLNRVLKSSDLIGITPTVVTQEMVGQLLAVFTSLEVKRPGWRWAGTDREQAQLAWIELIRSLGGVAGFTDNADGRIIWPR